MNMDMNRYTERASSTSGPRWTASTHARLDDRSHPGGAAGWRTPGAGPVSSRRILGSRVHRGHTHDKGGAQPATTGMLHRGRIYGRGHSKTGKHRYGRSVTRRRPCRQPGAEPTHGGRTRWQSYRPTAVECVLPTGARRLRGCLRGRLRCRLRGRLRCRLDVPLRPGEAAGRRPRLWPCVPVHSRRTRGRQYACARCGERCLLRAHLSTRTAWPRVGSRFARSTSTSTFIAPRPAWRDEQSGVAARAAVTRFATCVRGAGHMGSTRRTFERARRTLHYCTACRTEAEKSTVRRPR